MEELVSVIVPIYNVEKYLDRCVDSIVKQTYHNLEIILVDDGSPDNCPQMCDAWAERDSRIHVIHKQNQGLGMARNTGIEHATGEYICFFDSDDFVSADTIKKACTAAKEACSDIVVFGMQRVNRDGVIIQDAIPETKEKCFYGKDVQEQLLPDLIDNRHRNVQVKNFPFSACSCLFSMKIIREVNWRFVSERELISEDSYSLIWLYKYAKCVAIVPEPLYYYRENQASLTNTFRSDRHEKNRRFYIACMQLAEEQGYSDAVLQSISGLFMGFTIAAMKQLVASNLDPLRKRKFLSEIVHDDVVQKALNSVAHRQYGRARKILFLAMKYRSVFVCWQLVKAQNLRS